MAKVPRKKEALFAFSWFLFDLTEQQRQIDFENGDK